MPTVELTARRAREARPGTKDTILFDKALPGFGLRIHPSGRKIYVLQARIEGRTRRMGHRPPRRDAPRRGAPARTRPARPHPGGREPRRGGPQGQDGTDPAGVHGRVPAALLSRTGSPRGARPCASTSRRASCPALGAMALDAIAPEDVAAWFDEVSRDRPGAANRAFEILRAMMFRAEDWGWRARDTNPCLGIQKNPRRKVARFLDAGELDRLGCALDTHEQRWPSAVAAIRLLALTGCRRSEVLDLRWGDIGDDAIRLADSKTGPRAVPLGDAARQAHRCAPRRARPRHVPVPAPRREPRPVQLHVVLAHRLRRRRSRQPAAPRPAPYRGQPRGDVRRDPCPLSASCSAIAATGPPPATRTWPTIIWSRPPSASAPSSPPQWQAAMTPIGSRHDHEDLARPTVVDPPDKTLCCSTCFL